MPADNIMPGNVAILTVRFEPESDEQVLTLKDAIKEATADIKNVRTELHTTELKS